MARPERVPLAVPIEVGTGQAVNVFRLRDKTVQVSGVFAGSLQLEGTIDGEDFESMGGALTAPGFVVVPLTVELVRVRLNELTSGAPRVTLAGFDVRAR